MKKTLYHISPPDRDSVQWQQCRLFVEVGERHFFYVVLSGENEVVALSYHEFPAANIAAGITEMEALINEDEIFRAPVHDTTIILNFHESCLVPEAYFDSSLNTDIIELSHGDLHKGVISSENIPDWKIYNVYRLPVEITDFHQRQFPGAPCRHYYTLWLQSMNREHAKLKNSTTVIFYPGKMLVTVIAGEFVHLVQTIEYQTNDDALFHLLNLYVQFGFDGEKTILEIGGLIDPGGDLYQELSKHFPAIQRVSLPEAVRKSDPLKRFEEHLFSPLLKLALCVS